MNQVPNRLQCIDGKPDEPCLTRGYKHHKTARKMHYVRREQRTDIKVSEWGKQGYAKTNVCEVLLNEVKEETVDRVHIKDLPYKRLFLNIYARFL